MSIAVIGQGFVGGSLSTVISSTGETVFSYDKLGKVAPGSISTNAKNIKELIDFCESKDCFSGIYFVCVPTPMMQNGNADLSIVESVLEELASSPGNRIAIVKSTVIPGSTERWNDKFSKTGLSVVFNPEFLTEVNALNDMKNQDRIILGGRKDDLKTVKKLFKKWFPKVKIVMTSSANAEMVKYVTNCFLAVKVSFANEIFQVCKALSNKGLNIDYDDVINITKLDNRVGQSHWKVPGPVLINDGVSAYGFGGHCLPKDINALINLALSLEIDPKTMTAAWNKNLEVRPKQDRDWLLQYGRAVSFREENNE